MALLLIACLLLPLFPLSMPFNALLNWLKRPGIRFAVVLIAPQLGVLALDYVAQPIPDWLPVWALASAAFYAIRLLSVRDLGMWAGFLATSALALVWIFAAEGAAPLDLHLFAFGLSLPPALLMLLAGTLVRRFGAAYAGLHGGLGRCLPRWSRILIWVVLAAIATPVFPGFFIVLGLVFDARWPSAAAILFVWLIWSWAGTRLLQGFVFDICQQVEVRDLRPAAVAVYSGALALFLIAGLIVTGGVL
ncbi:MAG: hypothetical protein GZ085_05230 [Sulfuriferula multivorans]|uniref:Uncharacterized protein n=1 Tax=Sulfuriferula multivorans TaxID=1559896 RepID=A0A7C9KY32_9PROT|nr:hypothetical protein [Sulfuriferula multivorans]